MPKVKTRRAAAKRFTRTATGKIKVKKSFLRHILTKKSSKSKRQKRLTGFVHSSDFNRVSRCIPYA